MPKALTARRSIGIASTSAPRPSPQASIISVHPVGTATMKPSARRRPKLAASAVDSVVFGPGVKLIAVAKSSSAVNSWVDIGAVYEGTPTQGQYTLPSHDAICTGGFASTSGFEPVVLPRPFETSPRVPSMSNSSATGALSRGADTTLTDQLSARFSERIRQRLLAPGTRLPSVRECARRHG